MKKLQIGCRDGSIPHQRFEIHDFLPETRAIENDRDLFCQLLRLHERKNFEKLVDRSESAGEDHQRLRQIREPELAHEEIVEFEVEFARDERIRQLLEGKADVQSDR